MVLVKRHIAKSISYRILGTSITIFLAVSAGMELKWASILGAGELILKPLTYFAHERIWYKWVKYGIKKEDK